MFRADKPSIIPHSLGKRSDRQTGKRVHYGLFRNEPAGDRCRNLHHRCDGANDEHKKGRRRVRQKEGSGSFDLGWHGSAVNPRDPIDLAARSFFKTIKLDGIVEIE